MRISGYPIVFGVDSVDLGGFIEQIAPSAVDRMLRQQSNIVALWNHNSGHPLGRTSARTLALRKEASGLAINLDVDESIGFAADLVRVIRRGDAVGGSFAFRAIDDVWTLRDGMPHRTVLDMAVSEISVGVTFPAYRDTTLSATTERAAPIQRTRSLAFAQKELKQMLAR